MSDLSRRQLLRAAGAGAALLGFGPLVVGEEKKEEKKAEVFTLPKLPYAYDALEPYIDAETMMIHHDRHHAAYVTNLNKALEKTPEFFKMTVVEILKGIDKVPEAVRQAVINNGGGDANHTLFWNVMQKAPKTNAPSGAIAKAIDGAFDSFAKFQEKMTAAAMTRFGSGWAWLVADGKGKLEVLSTANQDSPYLKGQTPLLGLDVWEHAYYLKYRNLRADYVKAWWNVVNWDHVAMRLADATKG
jgi:Fe-Mn family superoxide dismutase